MPITLQKSSDLGILVVGTFFCRVDLANIVRRRGYKLIKELLANSNMEDCNELVSEENTNMETSASGIFLEDSLTGQTHNSLKTTKNDVIVVCVLSVFTFLIYFSGVEGQGEEALDVVDGNLSTERPSSTEIYFTATDGRMSLGQEINNFPEEGDIAISSPEAEEQGSMCKDESSLAGVSSMENSLSNVGDSNHSGEITENTLKIESVELDNRADIENSSPEASISANHSLVLDDTSSCSEIDGDNILVTEDEVTNDVDGDFSYNYDHYTSPDLNNTKHVDTATESLAALNSENTMANALNSLVESDDKDWMLGLSSSTSSIEEKTTRFIQNGYLDTVDGMFDLLNPIL